MNGGMKVGIVGVPQSGKTTLFRALTRGTVSTDEYGSEGRRVHVGVVAVPDRRLDVLAAEFRPKKVTHASIEFIDGAARVVREDSRARFGTDFFADVRQVDALVHVVRGFENASGESVSPARDAQLLGDELILADLQMVENRIERVEKQLHGVKKGVTTPATIEMNILERVRSVLEEGRRLDSVDLSQDEDRLLRGYDFLTLKPVICVLNIPESDLGSPGAVSQEFFDWCGREGIPGVELCAKVEMEVAELPDDEERTFLDSLGISEPARNVLIRECYAALGLITFFTANETEVRAWTLPRGGRAIDAAATVHSDLARGFIRAEVASISVVEEAGGWEHARRQGRTELHGKEYVVQDGDVIYIRFKV